LKLPVFLKLKNLIQYSFQWFLQPKLRSWRFWDFLEKCRILQVFVWIFYFWQNLKFIESENYMRTSFLSFFETYGKCLLRFLSQLQLSRKNEVWEGRTNSSEIDSLSFLSSVMTQINRNNIFRKKKVLSWEILKIKRKRSAISKSLKISRKLFSHISFNLNDESFSRIKKKSKSSPDI